MSESDPFIPKDKPKSWVVGLLAGLAGIAVGLVAFAAAWAGIIWLKSISTFLFVLCWLAFAVSWFVFISGLLTNRYDNMQPKEWDDQLW